MAATDKHDAPASGEEFSDSLARRACDGTSNNHFLQPVQMKMMRTELTAVVTGGDSQDAGRRCCGIEPSLHCSRHGWA